MKVISNFHLTNKLQQRGDIRFGLRKLFSAQTKDRKDIKSTHFMGMFPPAPQVSLRANKRNGYASKS